MKTFNKNKLIGILAISLFFMSLSIYVMYHYFLPVGKLNNVRLQKNIMDTQNTKLPMNTMEELKKIKSKLEYAGLTDNNMKVLYPKSQGIPVIGDTYEHFREIYSMGKGEIYKYKDDYFLKADRVLFNFYDYLASTPRVFNQAVFYTDGYDYKAYPRYDYYRILIKEQSLSDFDTDKLIYVGEYVDNDKSYPLFYHNIQGTFYCAKIGKVINKEYNNSSKLYAVKGINTVSKYMPKSIELKKASDVEKRKKILSVAYAKRNKDEKKYILMNTERGAECISISGDIKVKEYMVGFYSEVVKNGNLVGYKFDTLSEYNFASYYVVARKMIGMDLKVTDVGIF